MAFIAPILGTTGGNLALAALGIGIQLAAAYFFPQKIKGPRAESLDAQTAKFGDPIARVHGSGRTAGAAIWLREDKITEHKSTEREGKALGPEVTTFTYTADFAVAFAWNGPAAAIPRIWADDKLILDNSAETLEALLAGDTEKAIGVAKGATIKFYLGTQTQTPDPDIESDRGVGNVPAWPGIVYVVFINFPLDEFGTRLPNIEAEVVMSGEESFTEYQLPDEMGRGDLAGNVYVTSNDVGDFTILSLPGFVPIYTGSLAGNTGSEAYVTGRGDVVISDLTASPVGRVHFFDAGGGGETQTIEFPKSGFSFGNFADVTVEGVTTLFLHESPVVAAFENDGTEWELIWTAAAGVQVISGSFSASPEYLYYIDATDNSFHIMEWADGALMTQSPISPPGMLGEPIGTFYDSETDSTFVLTTLGIFAYDTALAGLIASYTEAPFFPLLDAVLNTPRWNGPAGSGTLVLRNHGVGAFQNDVIQLRKADLTLVQYIDFDDATPGWTNVGSAGTWQFSPEYGFMRVVGFNAISNWFLPRVARLRVPLAEIIAAECGFVDLPNDVSGITGDVVGYIVRDTTPPRGVFEDLMRVKFFDFTQSEGTTKFFMRTQTASRSMTIPEDLGYVQGSDPEPRFVVEDYTDFRELPQRVVIDYQAYDADYRLSSQAVSAPEGMNEGATPVQFQTSLVMSDDEAMQSADILFNEIHDSAASYHSGAGPKFLELHPGDVVNLDLEETVRTVRAVVTRMEGESAINFDFLRRTTIYTSDAVGVPTPNNPQSLLGIARIGAVFIDGHLMRAADDGDAFYTGIYAAEGGRFGSGTIFKSNDLGVSYSPWLGFATAVWRGLAQNVLPDRPHSEAWDYASTLNVFISNRKGVPNSPSSVTEDALLADDELNGFAVRSGTEWEYIQAAEITGDTDGTWTLSKLLRGRKGTDSFMGGHAVGNMVVYLDTATLDRPPDGEKDLVRVYASIATSTVFTDQFAVHFTNRARGLRPWAPWGVTGERDASGNLTINWFRRDRLGQTWPEGGPEDPPMSESVEDYDVFIYDVSGGIVRTIPASISEAPYSAADQSTDFGAPVPVGSLVLGVVQNSTTYGAGNERLATV